jgi:hypothetical protein
MGSTADIRYHDTDRRAHRDSCCDEIVQVTTTLFGHGNDGLVADVREIKEGLGEIKELISELKGGWKFGKGLWSAAALLVSSGALVWFLKLVHVIKI